MKTPKHLVVRLFRIKENSFTGLPQCTVSVQSLTERLWLGRGNKISLYKWAYLLLISCDIPYVFFFTIRCQVWRLKHHCLLIYCVVCLLPSVFFQPPDLTYTVTYFNSQPIFCIWLKVTRYSPSASTHTQTASPTFSMKMRENLCCLPLHTYPSLSMFCKESPKVQKQTSQHNSVPNHCV